MPAPGTATLGQTYTFTLQALNANNSPVDTDALPTYSVYEDETDTAIKTGTMAKLDDSGTTGFYSEELTISSANGYDLWQSYAVRISAAISSVAVSKIFAFRVTGTALAVTATSGALTTTGNFKTYIGLSGSDDDTLIASLITRATSAIQGYCDRDLILTTYRERYDGTGEREIFLNQYPITDIDSLSIGIESPIELYYVNASAWNAQISVTSTALTLTSQIAGSSDTTTSFTLSSYSLTSLVAAITGTSGWSATLLRTDMGVWSASEILPVAGLRAFDTERTNLITPTTPINSFKFESATGRLFIGSGFACGAQNVIIRYTAGYATTPADLEQITIDLVNTYYQSRKTDTSVKSESLGDHSKTYVDGGAGGAKDIPEHIAKRLAPYKKLRMVVGAC